MKMAIDGSGGDGTYRVDCECGEFWRGHGQADLGHGFSPALPIAECVAHIKLAHPEERPDIRFSDKFQAWLLRYWSRASLMQASALTVGR